MQTGAITLARQSRESMTKALLQLMRREDFNKITILQICQEAGLSRRTFYRHFGTKEQILLQLLEDLRQDFADDLAAGDKGLGGEIFHSFVYFDRHRELLGLLDRHRLFYLVKDMLEAHMKEACDGEYGLLVGQPGMKPYFDSYLAGSLSAILELWVRSGFEKTPEELALFACRLHQGVGEERKV